MNITYFDPSSNTPNYNLEAGLKLYAKHFFIGLIVVNLVLGVIYLMMLNALATQGFDMEALKAEQLSYQKAVEEMDITLAIPSSIYALESDESVQSMKEITKKDFVNFKTEKVVMR